MINHVRTLLLWRHPLSLDAGVEGYEFVPSQFSPPHLSGALRELHSVLMSPSSVEVHCYDSLGALLTCVHAPEVVDLTLAFDPRTTYAVRGSIPEWIRERALSVRVSKSQDCNMELAVKRVDEANQTPGAYRSVTVRKVSGSKYLEVAYLNGDIVNRRFPDEGGRVDIRPFDDIIVTVESDGPATGSVVSTISSRIPRVVNPAEVHSRCLDLAVQAHNEMIRTTVTTQSIREAALSRLLRTESPHAVVGLSCVLFSSLAGHLAGVS